MPLASKARRDEIKSSSIWSNGQVAFPSLGIIEATVVSMDDECAGVIAAQLGGVASAGCDSLRVVCSV
jgi:hypothetical protein